MQIQQLLHWCCYVRRSAILHKNCAIHTSALLQCWNELVSQKRFITCIFDCTGCRIRRTNLLEKERANYKCCHKPAPLSELLENEEAMVAFGMGSLLPIFCNFEC
ncbi:hypothetical protein AVEN_112779-1 [Araneus ventricosus]|uniref:Uncharacterized protein n=1 Tax=Araneus ventricosus TaxID=182803 RepID=A0A4Y2VJD1_ARAVE|nr:hypothetical protein AVEN_112779-1 [Araneus ventricosus]